MAVVPTRLILTPTFDDTKRMTVQGAAAVNEIVALTVVGVAASGAVPAGLTLRLVSQCGRTEYARFPTDLGEVWGVSNADATCSFKLNTAALQALFARLCSDAVIEAEFKLENGTTSNLYASGRFVIRNWIQNDVSPVAGSAQLQAQLDVLTERIESHQHDATVEGESAFPHNNLTDRDVEGVHPELEADVEGAVAAAQLAQSSALTAISNASTALTAAQGAAQQTEAVMTLIQDGISLTQLTKHSDGNAVKSLLNSIVAYLNTIRSQA